MKLAAINGQPWGEYSITLQTLLYLQRRFPAHEFRIYQMRADHNLYKKQGI